MTKASQSKKPVKPQPKPAKKPAAKAAAAKTQAVKKSAKPAKPAVKAKSAPVKAQAKVKPAPAKVQAKPAKGAKAEDPKLKSKPKTAAELKARVGSGVAVLVAVNEGRASVAVGVTDDLTATRSAVDLVKLAVAALGGQGGGGRPDMAQGGGPDGGKADAAVAAVKAALSEVAVAA